VAFIDADRCVWRAINVMMDSSVVSSQCDAAAVSISHAHLQFAVDAPISVIVLSVSRRPARIRCCWPGHC